MTKLCLLVVGGDPDVVCRNNREQRLPRRDISTLLDVRRVILPSAVQ